MSIGIGVYMYGGIGAYVYRDTREIPVSLAIDLGVATYRR